MQDATTTMFSPSTHQHSELPRSPRRRKRQSRRSRNSAGSTTDLTLCPAGKRASGRLQGLGASPQQLQPLASSCSSPPPAPARAPRPPPPPPALAPFHPCLPQPLRHETSPRRSRRSPDILLFQRRRFTLIFEIADVKKPILGADFLTVNGLVVDLQQGCITSSKAASPRRRINTSSYTVKPNANNLLDLFKGPVAIQHK